MASEGARLVVIKRMNLDEFRVITGEPEPTMFWVGLIMLDPEFIRLKPAGQWNPMGRKPDF
jgi:hypothetical protein